MDMFKHFNRRAVLCSRWLHVTTLALIALSPTLLCQESAKDDSNVHLPTDWSHHHLVYSNPRTAQQAVRAQADPRYGHQLARRLLARLPEEEVDGALVLEPQTEASDWRWRARHRLKRDWSQDMGAGATVGAGQYPAKFSFSVTTFSCSTDFVAYNTSLAGATTQASIIAYKNLYAGCTGTVPSVYWAYNTGGTIGTSVTLSPDGSQMAFVQAAPSTNVATLVLLKWKSSTTETAGAPMTLSNTAAASYRACTAPCMTAITFSGTTPIDTYSAPYYDFTTGSDTLYVGDDTGFVHQFTGVFSGTPAETTITWPVQAATAKLSSPVFDSASGNVFVTTSYTATGNSGARLAAVCAKSPCNTQGSNGNATVAIGTVTPSLVLGPTKTAAAACHAPGTSGDTSDLRLDSPIIDSMAGKVYVFLGNDGNGNSAVIQFSTTVSVTGFSYHSCGTETTVGGGSTTGIPLFGGTFDNLYFNSTGGSPTGFMYACGNTSGPATLYQIKITANVPVATGTSVLALSSVNATCSPVTEVFSANTDLIFLSVDSAALTAGTVKCPSAAGCIMSFSVPKTLAGALPSGTTATLAANGGTSGIIIDNTIAAGSQVYYSTIGNQSCTGGTGGCAVQASQAALQ